MGGEQAPAAVPPTRGVKNKHDYSEKMLKYLLTRADIYDMLKA